ncbi:MAG: pilus assembly protein TadG-related protein [Acidimicrobiales bacterium]
MRWRASHDERGQSTLLMAGVMVVIAVIGGALGQLGMEIVGRARVQAVADLTALAASHGDAEGTSIARRNGAVVVQLDHDGDVVTVVVQVDGRRAVASAER